MADIFDMADAWNDGGTVFTAIRMSVTDTASDADSLLQALLVGGVPKFTIDKAGSTKVYGHQAAYQWEDDYRSYGLYMNSGGEASASICLFIEPEPGDKKTGLLMSINDNNSVAIIRGTASNRLSIESDSNIVFITNNHFEFEGLQNSDPLDLIPYQKGSAIGKTLNITNKGQTPTYAIPLRVTAADDSLDIQNWYQSSTQVGRVDKDGRIYAGGGLHLGGADSAAPVAQNFSVQSVVAGTSDTAGADLSINGSRGTGTGVGGDIVFAVAPAGSSGSAQNSLQDALVIGGNFRVATKGWLDAEFGIVVGAFDLIIGGPSNAYGLTSRATGFLAWAEGGSDATGIQDLFIWRDAANILAQRNGANAQIQRWYETYTDASNYSRAYLSATSSAVTLGSEAAGTGTKRDVVLDGSNRATYSETAADIAAALVAHGIMAAP